MRTRRGSCYPREEVMVDAVRCGGKVKRVSSGDGFGGGDCRKRRRVLSFSGVSTSSTGGGDGGSDLFDSIPDDLVVCILCKLSSTARCPADFINVLMTCKRLNGLALNSLVLSKVSAKALAVRAKNWSESAHRFVRRCADAGSVEACYTLGMIRFYCLQNRGSGASLMAKAAINSHAPALYSLAVIQFNGSGGSKNDKDLRAGVALCARAAFLGHVDALRELGHCLQDGYGVPQNIAEGRRFLVQANARELAAVLSSSGVVPNRLWLTWSQTQPPTLNGGATVGMSTCPLLSDFGCNVPAPEFHPANRFLAEWFSERGGGVVRCGGGSPGNGLRLCSHGGCGRPETRKHEFRRCSVCGAVNYCSRACQALDWKLRHKAECSPVDRWLGEDADGGGDANDNVQGDGEVNGNNVVPLS
ncbi:PREDICTED: F-box protein At1g67340 [Tarenaya hassleriana]|uniref:F-box protein At1g67340 n=1 Tax=Tarenaya hassleriana TaxID=28532 RepID=UPI00053C98DA|nr:PREDICTED: F-box protein At1g67340 [Tarenaya hassleriana]